MKAFKIENNSNREFTCIDLIPQSKETIITNTNDQVNLLKTLKFVTDELIESIEKFYILKNYQNFDPHVGEAACQIRAVEILNLASEIGSTGSYIYRIIELKKMQSHIYKIVENVNQINIESKKYLYILDFFRMNNVLFSITEMEMILFHAYFLTKFKKYVGKDLTYIDHEKICKNSGFKRKFAKKLTRHSQLYLAKHSCNKILEWSTSSKKFYNLRNELEEMLMYDDDERAVLPCFYSADILISVIKEKKFPILVTVKHINSSSIILMAFRYSEKNKKFLNVKINSTQYFKSPCFIIEGTTQCEHDELPFDFAQRFNDVGVDTIVMANMASHPQYSGERLSIFKEDPFIQDASFNQQKINMKSLLVSMKIKALGLGCSKLNQSLFFINHIFCDTMESQIERVQNNNYQYNIIFDLNKIGTEKKIPLLAQSIN